MLGKRVAIKVSYSKAPHFCFFCKKLGHLESSCLAKVQQVAGVDANESLEVGAPASVIPASRMGAACSILGRGPSNFTPRRGSWYGGRGPGNRGGGRGGRGDLNRNSTYTTTSSVVVASSSALPTEEVLPSLDTLLDPSVNPFATLGEHDSEPVDVVPSDSEDVKTVFDEGNPILVDREVHVSSNLISSSIPTSFVPEVPEFEPVHCSIL